MNPHAYIVDELAPLDETSPRWEAWELIIEGFCPGAHEGARPALRRVETSTGVWGFCEACQDGWRASTGGFRDAKGQPYRRSVEVHHVRTGEEVVTVEIGRRGNTFEVDL